MKHCTTFAEILTQVRSCPIRDRFEMDPVMIHRLSVSLQNHIN